GDIIADRVRQIRAKPLLQAWSWHIRVEFRDRVIGISSVLDVEPARRIRRNAFAPLSRGKANTRAPVSAATPCVGGRRSIHIVPLNTFSTFGLTEPLLRALAKERFVEPTPIQASAIPHLLCGCDLLGIAQTGTGKTAAFALPILQHLISAPARTAHFATR